MPTRALLSLPLLLALAACINAGETGRTCAERVGEAIAACPAGSDPSLDAKALADCSATVEGQYDPVEVDGSVQAACTSFGECRVKCSFAVPCPCGVASVSRERIECVPCAVCGNLECEAGEDREGAEGHCPQDCATTCRPNAERCNGQHRERCSARGTWETVACSTGSLCRELDGDRTECRPSGSCTCRGISECCDGCLARSVGEECDDGLYCQVGSRCSVDGLCAGSQPRDCADSVREPACQAPTCDEQLKSCAARPINEGGVCENPATPAGDHCAAGACVQDGCECAGESACCDGCRPRNVGGACDDGLFCTEGEACSAAGRCEGARRDCSPASASACQRGECDETQDACIARPQRVGEACDDGLHCTSGTFCLADGSCGAGAPTDCSSVVTTPECQLGRCREAEGGCVAEPRNEGGACDDGLFCFEGSTCQADGRCAGGTPRDCAELVTAPDCQANPRCDEQGDRCLVDAVNAGRPCDDGRRCTAGETCDGNGACAGGETPDCAGEVVVGVCEVPACDKSVDACLPAPAPDGTSCDDGDPCTLDDACAAGACHGPRPKACPESECAQAGACDPATGACGAAPKPEGTPCTGGQNTRAECRGGACTEVGCSPGYDDCDAAAPGCETHTDADVLACGACGAPCRAGGRFRNAEVTCQQGSCTFAGCQVGFEDTDGDCAGGGPCANGCEACSPLADGTIDVPDDGADEDCSGADSTNTEALGVYVDVAFAPAGVGPCGGTPRGRRGCPYTSLFDAVLDLDAQNWSAPSGLRRYVYVAEGDYSDPGSVFETSRPLVVVGGYRRTSAGAWTRTGGATRIRATTPNAAAANLAPSSGWAALDGVHVGPELAFAGRVLFRRLGEAAGATRIRAVASPHPTTLQLINSTIGELAQDINQSCTPSNALCPGWQLRGVTARGSLAIPPQGIVADSTVHGGIQTAGYAVDDPSQPPLQLRQVHVAGTLPSDGWSLHAHYVPIVVEGTELAGHVYAPYGGPLTSRITSTRIGGHLTNYAGDVTDSEVDGVDHPNSSWDGSHLGAGSILRTRFGGPISSDSGQAPSVIDSVLEGPVSLEYEAWSDAHFAGNIVRGLLIMRYGAGRVRDNLLLGGVVLNRLGSPGGDSLTFDGNTIARPPAGDTAVRLEGPGVAFLNNLVLAGPPSAATAYGIRETGTDTDPAALLHNAFVGFDGVTRFPYLDEGTTPIADVRRLNTMASLEACARAGNVGFASDSAAGLVTSDPLLPDVGRLLNGPLVNAGLALPYGCSAWTVSSEATTDVTGASPRVCGPKVDIGAYELCP